MNTNQFFELESARLELLWQEGYFPALIESFELFAGNGQPLPDWLAAAVHTVLLETYRPETRTTEQGRGGGHRVRAERADKEEFTVTITKLYLDARKGDTRKDATRRKGCRIATAEDAYEAGAAALADPGLEDGVPNWERLRDIYQRREQGKTGVTYSEK